MAIPYTYHYTGTIQDTLQQFLRIFTGLQVQYGVDRDISGENDFRTCRVRYGSMDRVVAGVLNKNGTFTTESLPLITGYQTSIEADPERKIPKYHKENVAYTETDLTRHVSRKLSPAAYVSNVDITLWATNTEQVFQMLEQILLIFNPKIEFQTSEDKTDWSYITQAELVGIDNAENYPAGTGKQVVTWGLSFRIPFYLNYPKLDSTTVIDQIKLNISDNTNEVTLLEPVVISE